MDGPGPGPQPFVATSTLDQQGIREACTPHPPATVGVPVPVSVSVSFLELQCLPTSSVLSVPGIEGHGAVAWVPDVPGHQPADQSQPSDLSRPLCAFAEPVLSELTVLAVQSCVLPVLPVGIEREEAHTRSSYTRVSRPLPEPRIDSSGTPPRGYPLFVAPDPPALVREWPDRPPQVHRQPPLPDPS